MAIEGMSEEGGRTNYSLEKYQQYKSTKNYDEYKKARNNLDILSIVEPPFCRISHIASALGLTRLRDPFGRVVLLVKHASSV
jgi:hypothetical protein